MDQKEQLAALREAVLDLAGDVLALEACLALGGEAYGREVWDIWLQRLADYIHQHLEEASQLSAVLLTGGVSKEGVPPLFGRLKGWEFLEGGGNRNPPPSERVFGYFLHEQKVSPPSPSGDRISFT